jgi:hypothetical protein
MKKITVLILFLLIPALSLAAPMATINCAQATSAGQVVCDVALNEEVTLSSIQFQAESGWEIVNGECPTGANTEFFEGKLACSTSNDITTISLGTLTLSVPADKSPSQLSISDVDVTDLSFTSINLPEVESFELKSKSSNWFTAIAGFFKGLFT